MPAAAAPKSSSKRLVLIMSVIAGVLLLVATVLLTLLFAGMGKAEGQPVPSVAASQSGTDAPSASPLPSAEPEPSATPTPTSPPPPPPPPPPTPAPPVATGPTFTAFSPANNTSVGCSGSDPVSVTFTWSSTGANEAAFGVGTTDAFAAPLETGLPASGSFTWDYQCGNETQIYTVSIKGSSGQTNKTITLKR